MLWRRENNKRSFSVCIHHHQMSAALCIRFVFSLWYFFFLALSGMVLMRKNAEPDLIHLSTLTSFLALGAKQVLRLFLPRTMYKGPQRTYGVRVGPCWHLSDQIYHSFFFLPFFFLFWWTTGQRVLLVGLTPSNFEVVCCT